MHLMPPRVRPRRGAWRGSRRARAGAAACLASVLLGFAAPAPATAYPCADVQRPAAPTAGVSADDCRGADAPPPRQRKRGSMSSVAVLVLALAAVLLIPIGTRGVPSSLDPYGRELPDSERNRRMR
jgi:hypothetical protein